MGVVREDSEKKKSEPKPERGQEARDAVICEVTGLHNPGLQTGVVIPIFEYFSGLAKKRNRLLLSKGECLHLSLVCFPNLYVFLLATSF